MDKIGFDFFNVLLPASRVEEAANDIKDLIATGDVENEVEDNILRAELYVSNISQQNIPLNAKILCNISKHIYSRIYSWAGELKTESRTGVESVLKRISSQWDYSLIDDELRLELLAYAYHGVLKNKPFFDGNEKVARLFVNYLALKQDLPLFAIAPSKKDDKTYKKYLAELKTADDGDLTPLKERIRSVLYISRDGISTLRLGPSATVTDY
jgi:fido (protein-threonine AMPylation protein)